MRLGIRLNLVWANKLKPVVDNEDALCLWYSDIKLNLLRPKRSLFVFDNSIEAIYAGY